MVETPEDEATQDDVAETEPEDSSSSDDEATQDDVTETEPEDSSSSDDEATQDDVAETELEDSSSSDDEATQDDVAETEPEDSSSSDDEATQDDVTETEPEDSSSSDDEATQDDVAETELEDSSSSDDEATQDDVAETELEDSSSSDDEATQDEQEAVEEMVEEAESSSLLAFAGADLEFLHGDNMSFYQANKAYYEDQNYEEAITEFQAAIEYEKAHPSDPPDSEDQAEPRPSNEIIAKSMYWMGESYIKLNQKDQAVETFRQLTRGYRLHYLAPAARRRIASLRIDGESESA